MTDKRIADLPSLVSPENVDELVCVDVSDTTSSAQGTTKKITIQNLFNKTNFFGWANYSDSQYTAVSPLPISSGTRTLITNNTGGTSTNETYLNEAASLWNNDALQPVAIGDTYDVRISFYCTPATNDQDITLDLDIGTGGSPIKIYEETRRMLKGAGQVNSFVFAIPIFALDTFFINGGRFYITPSSNITLYGTTIFITKTFRNIS